MAPETVAPANPEGDPVVAEPAGRAPTAATLPLLGVAAGLLAAAGLLHGTGGGAGAPHFPVWLLLLGMGVIVLGGGVAVVAFGSTDDARSGPGPLAPFDLPEAPDPDVAEDEARRSNLPEPPKPVGALTGGFPSTGPRAPSGKPEGVGSDAGTLGAAAPHPGPAASPLPGARAGPGAAVSADSSLSCATCGRSLPAGAGWRRCRECGKSLCVKCLTESVRKFGSGYCASCAPRGA